MEKDASRRIRILSFIRSYSVDHQYPPTIREIGKAVNLSSTSTVHNYVKRLKDNGYITNESSRTRTITLTDLGEKRVKEWLKKI